MEHRAAIRPSRKAASRLPVAEYALALELLGDLGALESEAAVLGRLMEVCQLVCSPRRISCWHEGRPGPALAALLPPAADAPDLPSLEARSRGELRGAGLVVPIRHLGERLGLLLIEEVLFPEHLLDYLGTARFIAGIGGLAIANLRTSASLRESRSALEAASHKLQAALGPVPESERDIVRVCSYCKDVHDDDRWVRIERYLYDRVPLLLSHGICPTCFQKHFGDGD